MFSKEIEKIKCLTDEFADDHVKLGRINGDSYCGDRSIKAVTRILLFNRIPEGQVFNTSILSYAMYETLRDGDQLGANAFYIVETDNLDGTPIREKLTEKYKDFEPLQTRIDYLRKWITCDILVNTKTNVALFFIQGLNIRYLHLILSLFPAYFKSLFESDPLSEEERYFCASLAKRDSAQFEERIDSLVKKAGFTNEYTQHMLRKFTKNNMKRIVDASIEQRDQLKHRLDENMEEYRQIYAKLRDAIIKTEALLANKTEEDTELVEYFKVNKNLELTDIEGDTIKFFVLTELKWFDLDFYQRTAKNNSIYATNKTVKNFEKLEDRKLLMDAIFSDDPKFKVRMVNYYELSLAKDVRVRMNFTCPQEIETRYIRNPHMKYHACLGGYHEPIRRALRNNNMIGAIEQCVASAQSVDLIEHEQTFKPFIEELLSSNNKYIVDMEGNEYTALEALNKLKETT